MKNLYKKLKSWFNKIGLVDRFLMLFMLILLVYTAVNLFTGTTASQDSVTVNVIVRTSAAAIFGYFVSSNFIKENPPEPTTGQNIYSKTAAGASENRIKNQIGFEISSDPSEAETGKVMYNEYISSASGNCNKIQITVVSVVGIFSLILLFIAGKFLDTTHEISATVSQLRDFVSACVGFLVSCGKAR